MSFMYYLRKWGTKQVTWIYPHDHIQDREMKKIVFQKRDICQTACVRYISQRGKVYMESQWKFFSNKSSKIALHFRKQNVSKIEVIKNANMQQKYYQKKSERFRWFLILKIDLKSQI